MIQEEITGLMALLNTALLGNKLGHIFKRIFASPSPLAPGCLSKDTEHPCEHSRIKGLSLDIYNNPDLYDPEKLRTTGERYNVMVCGRLYELCEVNFDEELSSRRTEKRISGI